MAAARYLHVSYNHYKKYAKMYKDEDGVWEIFLIDSDENGKADQAYLDNDGDKKPDVLAHDYNEDGEWDKFEELS